MWEFYLAGSEAAFRVDGHMVFQIQIAKRQDVVPRTRDYIAEREEQLRRREAAGRRAADRRGAQTGSCTAAIVDRVPTHACSKQRQLPRPPPPRAGGLNRSVRSV